MMDHRLEDFSVWNIVKSLSSQRKTGFAIFDFSTEVSKHGGSPQSSIYKFDVQGFSMKISIQLWGYPHDYGNPHMI